MSTPETTTDRPRCAWGDSSDDYRRYHDEEWGTIVHGDDALFERMSLEAFQSGLSWITILRKRENFRRAFAGFHIAAVAEFDEADVDRLLQDSGIVRNGAKIRAVINNADVIARSGLSLDTLLWSYARDPDTHPRPRTLGDVPAVTDESKAMAKALKKLGFAFVGPTTAYALMQATGMVDDHVATCFRAGSANS